MMTALAAVALFAIGALPLWAEEVTLELDSARTVVSFTTSDTVHTVRGSFKLKRGSITYDPATGQAHGEVVVDATSEDTGIAMRDRKVKKDVLESQTYPEITFVPDHLEGALPPQGDFKVDIHGVFRIHGGDHEMTVPLQVQHKPDGFEVSTHFRVPYHDWGMKNPGTFFIRVSNRVEIDVRTVARLAAHPVDRAP
ncbi:MAG TPA: YceI family protein [Terriglobia bacterium]|nr:YceI family protein [Terriglobia bacterium]